MDGEKQYIYTISIAEFFILLLSTLDIKDQLFVRRIRDKIIKNSVINLFADLGIVISNYEKRLTYDDLKGNRNIYILYQDIYEYVYRAIDETYGLLAAYKYSFHIDVKIINSKICIILNPEK